MIIALPILAIFVLTGLYIAGTFLSHTLLGQKALAGLNWLFAGDSVQLWWYVTRSAGIIAYLLLWLSTVWGLAVPSKLLDALLDRGYSFDFHEFISLLSLGFVALHIGVLLLDRYLPYSIWQVLIPFLSPYRPVWVGIGVISLYITLLVTITFYMRSRIGMQTFRVIHILSLLGYLGVTLHGFFAGTDSPLISMLLMYQVTSLVVVFLTVYWLVNKLKNRPKSAQVKMRPRPIR
jgi:predicted ferric reductase